MVFETLIKSFRFVNRTVVLLNNVFLTLILINCLREMVMFMRKMGLCQGALPDTI